MSKHADPPYSFLTVKKKKEKKHTTMPNYFTLLLTDDRSLAGIFCFLPSQTDDIKAQNQKQ